MVSHDTHTIIDWLDSCIIPRGDRCATRS